VGIQPASFRLSDATHVGVVTLAISNLVKSVVFYRDVIGLAVLKQGADAAELGVGDMVLLKLFELPGVQPIGRRQRLGLYHTAILLPSRSALGSFIQHLKRNGVYYGAGDHIYSEALYLTDPDGLSVEIYADRPRGEWKTNGQELLSATDPVDIARLVSASVGEWRGAPAGTKVGHLHFYIGDLAKATSFYHDALGFALMTWSYPGALFISAGGYHHHIGLNVWAEGSPQAGPTDARLLSWELVVPYPSEIENVHSNLEWLGWKSRIDTNGTLTATDPWGITVHVVSH
jgi:catechol 2,3-dioxygenase